jgi:hypothetical protein
VPARVDLKFSHKLSNEWKQISNSVFTIPTYKFGLRFRYFNILLLLSKPSTIPLAALLLSDLTLLISLLFTGCLQSYGISAHTVVAAAASRRLTKLENARSAFGGVSQTVIMGARKRGLHNVCGRNFFVSI